MPPRVKGKPVTRRKRKRREPYTRAGPVTIVHPDGTVTEQPPYDRSEFYRLLSRSKKRSQ